MRIGVHLNQGCTCWLVVHASNGAILATGKTREEAINKLEKVVQSEIVRLRREGSAGRGVAPTAAPSAE